MKKCFFVMLVLVAAFALAACGETEKEGTGYGLVHSHYVGEVTVKLVGDRITEMTIEEYYLPYNAGQLLAVEGWADETPENVVKRQVTNAQNVTTTTYYAKYFYVAGTVYTGSLNSSNAIQYLNGTTNIEDWVKNEANAKAYVEAVLAGNVFVIDSPTATSASSLVRTGNAANGWTKSTTGYWTGPNFPLGWTGNMTAIIDTLMETGVNAVYSMDEDGFWGTVDHVSGATLVDFVDYQNVAKRAVANAK